MIKKIKIILRVLILSAVLILFGYMFARVDTLENEKTLVEQRNIKSLEVQEKGIKNEWEKLKKAKEEIEIKFKETDKEMYLYCIRIEKQKFFDDRIAFSEDRYSRCRQYLLEVYDLNLGYQIPLDLYYTYMKYDGVYISQTPQEHFKNNGLLATDVATGGRGLEIHAPDINNFEKEYTISYLKYEDYPELGRAMILTSTDTLERYILGHIYSNIKEGENVRTGDVIGKTLCPGEEMSGATTGCHVHIMYQTGVVQEKKDKWYVPNFLEEPKEFINWSATEYKTQRNYFKHDVWKENREKIENEIENKGWYVKEGFDVFNKASEGFLAWDDELFKEAANEFNIDWRVLSAVALREHRRGTETAKSDMGALGTMQFLPCTWFNWGVDPKNPEGCYGYVNIENAFGGKYERPRGYATDGDGDGIADIHNYKDSVYSAAKMLKANYDKCGGYQCSLLVYNKAQWYVDQVMGFAYEMGLPYPTK